MIITLTRLDRDGRYETVISRDDGVRFRMRGVAHNSALPHDILHLIVESELGIDGGLWGSIARGAELATMTWLDGRRRPMAAERSKTILRANARSMVDAENLVAAFATSVGDGSIRDVRVLISRVARQLAHCGHLRQRLSSARVASLSARCAVMLERWRELSIGDALEITW